MNKKLSVGLLLLTGASLMAMEKQQPAEEKDKYALVRLNSDGTALFNIQTRTDTAPLGKAAREALESAWVNRPSIPSVNPLALTGSLTSATSSVLSRVMPVLANKEIFTEIMEIAALDLNNGFQNAVPLLQHFIHSGILCKPEHFDYVGMVVDAFCEKIDPQFLAPWQGIINLLNSFRYQAGSAEALKQTNIPDLTGFAIEQAIKRFNTYQELKKSKLKSRQAQQDVLLIPLKQSDDALVLHSEEPTGALKFISIQNIFFMAAFVGNIDVVRDLICRYPILANRQDGDDKSVLYYAADGYLRGYRSDVVFEYLLEHGAQYDAILFKKRTSVAQLIEEGLKNKDDKEYPRYKRLADLLEKRKSFIAAWEKWVKPVAAGAQPAPAPEFNVPGEAVTEFDGYLRAGNLDEIIILLDKYPRLKYMKDVHGMTILHRTVVQILSPYIAELQAKTPKDKLSSLLIAQASKTAKVVPAKQLALAKQATLQIEEVAQASADKPVVVVSSAAPARQLSLAQPQPVGLPNYITQQHARIAGQQIQVASSVLSYLLNTCIPTDVQDNDGKQHFSIVMKWQT